MKVTVKAWFHGINWRVGAKPATLPWLSGPISNHS